MIGGKLLARLLLTAGLVLAGLTPPADAAPGRPQPKPQPGVQTVRPEVKPGVGRPGITLQGTAPRPGGVGGPGGASDNGACNGVCDGPQARPGTQGLPQVRPVR